jgi:hypothetical protein
MTILKFSRRLILTSLFVLTSAVAFPQVTSVDPQTQGVSPDDCFPIERLRPELRQKASDILWKMLDSEGLYTVIGNLKPMSSGFASVWKDANLLSDPASRELSEIVATFQCGRIISSGQIPFSKVTEGKRYFDAFVFNHTSLSKLLTSQSSFFTPLGFYPEFAQNPLALVMGIERETPPSRGKGLGLLFGYPEPAVNFFVSAQDEGNKNGTLIPRDFRQVATYASETGNFVYAVPKGAPMTEDDKRIRAEAGKILSAYRERRKRFFGPDKPGPAALIREWFTGPDGKCHPNNAKY